MNYFRALAALLTLASVCILVGLTAAAGGPTLQNATPTDPAPTLIPPTPLPTATPQAVESVSESGLVYAQENKVLRVGTYYNAYPFVWLNELGQVDGYEAEIMQAIGVELGVQPEFVQVTRHNALKTLQDGRVDVLIGQQVLARDREDALDFSHPYYLNQERVVVQQDSTYADLSQLAGLPVSVEIGSRSERALRHWSEQNGITFDIRTYFSESEALDALAQGEVQAMVGQLDSLRRAGRQQMRLLDQPVLLEPYAIALRRWDVNTRNLLDRSLQRLKASGRMDEIFAHWFPDDSINFTDLIPVYDSLYADERGLDQFNTDLPMPANLVLERIQNGQPIRVAGLISEGESAPANVRIMNDLNKALIEEMARRWNVQIEYVPNSALNAEDLVASGQADLAVGISPRWTGADRVEYSLPYIQHGNRLLVPERSPLTGFDDMLGTGWWIGYFADDAADEENIRKLAEMFGVEQNIQTFAIQREEDAIYAMTTEDNIKVIFGDSLRLLALMREDPNSGVKMLEDWYGDVLPITFAMPRNDANFRTMVNFTLQDIAQDGTYRTFWESYFGLGDPLTILPWPVISPDTP